MTPTVCSFLTRLTDKMLRAPEIRAKWRKLDGEPLPMTSPQFIQSMHADAKRWGEAVRLSGFEA